LALTAFAIPQPMPVDVPVTTTLRMQASCSGIGLTTHLTNVARKKPAFPNLGQFTEIAETDG